MAYAQTNYQQLQGKTVNGVKPRYSIAQIGCFITAFCNLLDRYGKGIAPDAMDNELAKRNLYTDVDDGVYDDVGWSTICAFDSTISITATGSGKPISNDSIVKFNYRSPNTGQFTTHFSLVLNASAGTIIDSWDGQVKSWNVYGGPIAYASYVITKPQPVAPVQGDDMPLTRQDIIDEYQVNRGANPSEAEIAGHLKGGTWRSLSLAFKKENNDRRAAADKLANDLQAQLTAKQLELDEADNRSDDLNKTIDNLTTRQGELNKIIQVQQNQLTANNCTTTVSIKQAVQVLVQAFKDWIK